MADMTMADLLANQEKISINLYRGQEISGNVVAIPEKEIILDLGTKAEGVLPKRDLPPAQLENLKIGDELKLFVAQSESESGQVILSVYKPQRLVPKGSSFGKQSFPQEKLGRFENLKNSGKSVTGRGIELNKGGLIVEVEGVRGFLPTSQMSLASAASLEELIGEELEVKVIEIDSNQNRLIFSQKTELTDEEKKELSKLKVGDTISGKVAAVMPFGVFVTIEGGGEGLVHISEVSWDRVEDAGSLFKAGDPVSAKVVSVDTNTGRVNMSIRHMSEDPFKALSEKYLTDDVIKATIAKVTSQGIFFKLGDGVEGFMGAAKQEADTTYEVGKPLNVLVDNIDTQKRRVNLVPFVTSTKDLIYK